MNHNLLKYIPPGFPIHTEFGVWLGGMIFSVLYSFSFFASFSETKKILSIHQELQQETIMPDFVDILDISLAGFLVMAFCMLIFIFIHHVYYYQGSKSIYLMRRLPTRFELIKRNITLPILAAVSCLLIAFLFLLIYFAYYMLATPKDWLMPDQWQKIWREWI